MSCLEKAKQIFADVWNELIDQTVEFYYGTKGVEEDDLHKAFSRLEQSVLGLLVEADNQITELKEQNERTFELGCILEESYKELEKAHSTCKSLLEATDERMEKLECRLGQIRKPEFLEKLADIEHRQWSHWTKYLCENGYMTHKPKVLEWLKQAKTPYKELSEEDKEKDRRFARCVQHLTKEELEAVLDGETK